MGKYTFPWLASLVGYGVESKASSAAPTVAKKPTPLLTEKAATEWRDTKPIELADVRLHYFGNVGLFLVWAICLERWYSEALMFRSALATANHCDDAEDRLASLKKASRLMTELAIAGAANTYLVRMTIFKALDFQGSTAAVVTRSSVRHAAVVSNAVLVICVAGLLPRLLQQSGLLPSVALLPTAAATEEKKKKFMLPWRHPQQQASCSHIISSEVDALLAPLSFDQMQTVFPLLAVGLVWLFFLTVWSKTQQWCGALKKKLQEDGAAPVGDDSHARTFLAAVDSDLGRARLVAVVAGLVAVYAGLVAVSAGKGLVGSFLGVAAFSAWLVVEFLPRYDALLKVKAKLKDRLKVEKKNDDDDTTIAKLADRVATFLLANPTTKKVATRLVEIALHAAPSAGIALSLAVALLQLLAPNLIAFE